MVSILYYLLRRYPECKSKLPFKFQPLSWNPRRRGSVPSETHSIPSNRWCLCWGRIVVSVPLWLSKVDFDHNLPTNQRIERVNVFFGKKTFLTLKIISSTKRQFFLHNTNDKPIHLFWIKERRIQPKPKHLALICPSHMTCVAPTVW